MKNNESENNKRQLESLILDTIRLFVESVYELKESEFNRVPFEGSWSPAEIGSHIKKSLEFIHQIVEGEVVATDRDPGQYIPELKKMMENMTAKSKSATELLPDSTFTFRTEVRNDLTAAEQLFLSDVQNLDLAMICKSMEFPGIGYLTRSELIHFAMFHTARHARQLQNIKNVIQEQNAAI